jgi:hypothetical protein
MDCEDAPLYEYVATHWPRSQPMFTPWGAAFCSWTNDESYELKGEFLNAMIRQRAGSRWYWRV